MPGVYAFFTGISGIFAALSLSDKNLIVFLIFLLLGVFFISLQKEVVLKIAGVVVFVLIFLNAFSGFALVDFPQIPSSFNGKEITLTAKVSDFSKQTIRPNSFWVYGIEINGKKFSGNGKVYCGMKDSPPPYSKVKIKGKIKIYPQNGLVNKINGTSYVIYADSVKTLKENSLMKMFSVIRKRIAQNTLLSMKSSKAMLLLSSVSGISAMDYASKIPFQETGTAHIFAVSGLHMGILGESSEKVFSFAGSSSGLITILILFTFVLLVGFRASALRAFLMFSISEIAMFLGKEQIPLNTLAFVALILALVNPLVIFTISFQLSLAAIFALIILAPKIFGILPSKFRFKALSQVISVQVILYPIIAYYFHSFSLVSFFANLVVIPLMYIVLPIGIVQILLSSISLGAAKAFAPVSNLTFGILEKTVIIFSKIPFSHLNVRYNLLFMLLYFFAIGVFVLSFSKSKRFKIAAAGLVIFTLLIPFFMPVRFYSIPLKLKGEDGFLIRDGKIAIYITSPTFLQNDETDKYAIEKFLAEKGINKISLLICNAPLVNNESSALRVLPSKYNIPDIIVPIPKTDLSESFRKLNENMKVHYVNDESTIYFYKMKIKLIKCGKKYAIFLRANNLTYLFVGKGCKLEGRPPYADIIFVPKGFDTRNLSFGKLLPY